MRLLKPGLGFDGPIPWLWILGLTLLAYLASWLVLSIHTWISMRWHSFTLAIGVGIAAIFLGLLASSTEVGRVYPWSLPTDVVFGEGERLPLAVALGIIGGIVVGMVGCWNVTHRDVL